MLSLFHFVFLRVPSRPWRSMLIWDDWLFTPKRIGAVEVPNRIVMPAMTTRLAEPDGAVSEATIAYFGARAAGGVGLVTVEMASPERAAGTAFASWEFTTTGFSRGSTA